MSRFTCLLGLLATFLLAGCDYFGTHEGYEEGEAPFWGVEGTADFAIVGIEPESAQIGDQVTGYLASEEEAPVESFDIDSFWFCTFDGESIMNETGGDEYVARVDQDEVLDVLGEVDMTEEELDTSVISSVTFTIPAATVTGEGLVITPSSEMEYFFLTIE